MEQITTVGIDLAQNVFSLHGVDGAGKTVLRRTVRRERLMETVASLRPCVIGMEACSGAHEWGRRFQAHGHTVRLMAPKFVSPYRKSDKNDGNDAEAVCEAVSRPSMRFVPVKSVEQQGAADPAPGAPGLRGGENRADQPAARAALGVRRRVGAGFADREAPGGRPSPKGCPSSRAARSQICSSSCERSMRASTPTMLRSTSRPSSRSRRAG
jgi:hypothetical protein